MLAPVESAEVMKNIELKKAREKKGLTQAQTAKMAMVSEISYQNYEAGRRVPNAVTAVLIARALGSTVEDLFG